MKYSRIKLSETTYSPMLCNWAILHFPDINQLNSIYAKYCAYKQFDSVMPIFDSQYDECSIIGYYDNAELVAFSLIKEYNKKNVECVQFAWDYANPKLRLGIRSLEHECALYRSAGYDYMYLGSADEYKSKFQGYEVLGRCIA